MNKNCSEPIKIYQAYLAMQDVYHTEMIFEEYSREHVTNLCPKDIEAEEVPYL